LIRLVNWHGKLLKTLMPASMHLLENMEVWQLVCEDGTYFLYEHWVHTNLFENCLGYLQ